jgi:hypothetical protein
MDLHLYDTYFVISREHLSLALLLLFTYLISYIVSVIKKFRTSTPNWILFVSGFTLVVFLTLLIKTFSQAAFKGMYPAYPEPNTHYFVKLDPADVFVVNALTLFQIVILLSLLYATYRSGSQRQ